MSIYPDYSTGQSHWFSGLSLSGAIALHPTAGSGQRRPRAWGGTLLAALGSTGGRELGKNRWKNGWFSMEKWEDTLGNTRGKWWTAHFLTENMGKPMEINYYFHFLRGNWQFICNGYFMILQQVFSNPGWIAGRYVLVDNSGIQGCKTSGDSTCKIGYSRLKHTKRCWWGGLGRSVLHESTFLIILRITDRVMHVSTATLLNLRGALLGCFWIMRPSFDNAIHLRLDIGHILSIYIYINTMWTESMCIVQLMQYPILTHTMPVGL